MSSPSDRPPRRPAHLAPPPKLPPSPPVPTPAPAAGPPEPLSPTRYGDWEHKGIAVDF